ncbi:Uncharacterised protein [Chlamydia trachomatis]|nr:Uncharacterised protein [Chlamydia trachomatis]
MPCMNNRPFAAPVQIAELVDILKMTPKPPVAIITASPCITSKR